MNALGTAQVAALAGGAGAALVLTATRRATLLAGLVLVALAETGLVASLAVARRLESPGFVVLGAAGFLVVAGIAAALARRPELVTPLLLAAAPFRLPLDFGREHRFFVAVAEAGQLGRLLPLYVVLAATTLLLAWRTLRGDEVRAVTPLVAWPAAAFAVLAAASLLWTDDLHAATNLLAYFLLPFAVLVGVVARAPFPPWLPRVLAAVAIALGCVFAVIGLVQAATEKLFFYAPNLEVSNSYSTYFRVTSLFRDPSLYGRHVVLAITVVLVAVWMRRLPIAVAVAFLALLWAGLYFSYSQSSFAALFAVTVWIAAVAGGRVVRNAVAVASVVVLAGGLVAALVTDASAKRVTSDRSRRVELTARVYRDHPVVGVGLGAQPLDTQRISTRKGPVAQFVSHTTPLTIAAELGTLGLLLYAALLVGAVQLVLAVRRRSDAFGLALGAALLALFVHSLFYSGFLEDPITWFALGAGASFLAAARA
jgi:hypothetical protein